MQELIRNVVYIDSRYNFGFQKKYQESRILLKVDFGGFPFKVFKDTLCK